jgi:predicted acetyltransferase
MITDERVTMLSDIPNDLRSGPVRLMFEKVGNPEGCAELVPFYHFKIVNEQGEVVGHINFRVGSTRHVNNIAGHIGYGIKAEHRGNSYSYYACRALAPFVRQHYREVVLTVETDNAPSIRIIEKLDAAFMNEMEVTEDDPSYASGARSKRRYLWAP